MKTRAAICFDAGHPLEIDMVDVRGPGEDEVLIEIKATGLCHSDWHQISGDLLFFPFPIIAGHEGAGVVLEVGANVTSLKPGDHVIPASIPECGKCRNCLSGRTNLCAETFANFGSTQTPFSLKGSPIYMYAGVSTFANHTVVKEIAVAKIRQDAPFDSVCLAGCGVMTGVGSVMTTAQVWPGSSVLVFGLGGIGLSVLQAARVAGATRIVGIDINPAREALARQLGATDFIDPNAVEGDLVQHLIAMTDGGADFSFECVGSTILMAQAVESVRAGSGVSVAIGGPAEGAIASIPPQSILMGRTWKGSLLGGVKPRSELPSIVDMCVDHKFDLESLITHRLPLEQINEGFALMKRGEAIRPVIVY